MVMIDLRNAIANILDRYSIAQAVEVTLRKMRRDGIVPPFTHGGSLPSSRPLPKRVANFLVCHVP